MRTLTDSPALRARRLAAYRAGAYQFTPPPVDSVGWDDQAWMNWVRFNDPELTGFLPYAPTTITRNSVPQTLNH